MVAGYVVNLFWPLNHLCPAAISNQTLLYLLPLSSQRILTYFVRVNCTAQLVSSSLTGMNFRKKKNCLCRIKYLPETYVSKTDKLWPIL